jgi:hypothetical protein
MAWRCCVGVEFHEGVVDPDGSKRLECLLKSRKIGGPVIKWPLKTMEDVLRFEFAMRDGSAAPSTSSDQRVLREEVASLLASVVLDSGADFRTINPMEVALTVLFNRFSATSIMDTFMSSDGVVEHNEWTERRLLLQNNGSPDKLADDIQADGVLLPVYTMCTHIMELLDKTELIIQDSFPPHERAVMPR